MKTLCTTTVFILALSIPCVSYAQEKQKTPKQNHAGQSRSEPEKKQQAEPPQTKDAAPPTSQQADTAEKKNEATHHEDDLEIQRRLVQFTKYLVVVGFLQFFALIVQAIVFGFTLRVINRQAMYMEEHARLFMRLAEETKNIALAAQSSAEAAKSNTEIIISKERPRISISTFPLELENTLRIKYQVSFYGSTVAFLADSSIVVSVTNSITPPSLESPLDLVDLPLTISPGFAPSEQTAQLYRDPLSQSEFDDIRDGKIFVHFKGFIQYKDVFEREHWTRFSYVWKIFDLRGLYGVVSGYWMETGSPEDNSET